MGTGLHLWASFTTHQGLVKERNSSFKVKSKKRLMGMSGSKHCCWASSSLSPVPETGPTSILPSLGVKQTEKYTNKQIRKLPAVIGFLNMVMEFGSTDSFFKKKDV